MEEAAGDFAFAAAEGRGDAAGLRSCLGERAAAAGDAAAAGGVVAARLAALDARRGDCAGERAGEASAAPAGLAAGEAAAAAAAAAAGGDAAASSASATGDSWSSGPRDGESGAAVGAEYPSSTTSGSCCFGVCFCADCRGDC